MPAQTKSILRHTVFLLTIIWTLLPIVRAAETSGCSHALQDKILEAYGTD